MFFLFTIHSPSGEAGEGGEGGSSSEGDNLVVIHSGDVITLDGSGGRILPGNMQPTVSLAQVMHLLISHFLATFSSPILNNKQNWFFPSKNVIFMFK